MPTTQASRSWLRFSLRGLILLTALLGCWLGYHARMDRQQAGAVARLHDLEVTLHYGGRAPDEQTIPLVLHNGSGSAPFRPAAGRWSPSRYLFPRVNAVTLGPEEIRSALPHLKALPHLEEVYLYGSSCGLGFAADNREAEILRRELPNVKVLWVSIAVVG